MIRPSAVLYLDLFRRTHLSSTPRSVCSCASGPARVPLNSTWSPHSLHPVCRLRSIPAWVSIPSEFVLSQHLDGLLRTWTADLLRSASSYGLRYVSVSSKTSSSIANDDVPSRVIPAALDPSKRSPHQAAVAVSLRFTAFTTTHFLLVVPCDLRPLSASPPVARTPCFQVPSAGFIHCWTYAAPSDRSLLGPYPAVIAYKYTVRARSL